jgi:hypothetical protein
LPLSHRCADRKQCTVKRSRIASVSWGGDAFYCWEITPCPQPHSRRARESTARLPTRSLCHLSAPDENRYRSVCELIVRLHLLLKLIGWNFYSTAFARFNLRTAKSYTPPYRRQQRQARNLATCRPSAFQ